MIKISHGNGVESWYAHCDTLKVKKGDKITAGQIIATMGDSGKATGPHLHLEIVVDGKRQNPQKYMY